MPCSRVETVPEAWAPDAPVSSPAGRPGAAQVGSGAGSRDKPLKPVLCEICAPHSTPSTAILRGRDLAPPTSPPAPRPSPPSFRPLRGPPRTVLGRGHLLALPLQVSASTPPTIGLIPLSSKDPSPNARLAQVHLGAHARDTNAFPSWDSSPSRVTRLLTRLPSCPPTPPAGCTHAGRGSSAFSRSRAQPGVRTLAETGSGGTEGAVGGGVAPDSRGAAPAGGRARKRPRHDRRGNQAESKF